MTYKTLSLIVSATMLIGLSPTPLPAAQTGAVARATLPPAWLSSPAQTFSPKLTEYNIPGAATVPSKICGFYCGTMPYAINGHGTITGFYTDKYVVPHGFILSGGQYQSFDAPGAGLGHGLNEGTVAQSINDSGLIGGQFEDVNLVYHGFLRDAQGHFKTVDAPGAGTGQTQGTIIQSINRFGAFAGFVRDSTGFSHGFVKTSGGFTTFDPPGSTYTRVCPTACINGAGTVVGAFYDGTQYHGFIRATNGAITVVDGPNAAGTLVTGINDRGEISGYYYDSNYVGTGFVAIHNVFNYYQVLGDATQAEAINSEGAQAGLYFTRSEGTNLLYYRKSDGEETTFPIPGSGRHFDQGAEYFAMNAFGTVTGYWQDPAGLEHGYLLTH